MPTLNIRGKDFEYDEDTIIRLPEGIIGFPQFKRAVLIEDPEFSPFLWFASTDDHELRFVVAEAFNIFPELDLITLINESFKQRVIKDDTVVLTLVMVSSDWQNTTFNLKAPVLIEPHRKNGAQIVLSGTDLNHAERIPE